MFQTKARFRIVSILTIFLGFNLSAQTKVEINGSTSDANLLTIAGYGKAFQISGCQVSNGATKPVLSYEYRIPGRHSSFQPLGGLGESATSDSSVVNVYTVPIGSDPNSLATQFPENSIEYKVYCTDPTNNDARIDASATTAKIQIASATDYGKPIVTDFACGDLLNVVPNQGGSVRYTMSNVCLEGVAGWYDVNNGNTLLSGSANSDTYNFVNNFNESRYVVRCNVNNIYQGSIANLENRTTTSQSIYPKRRYLPPPTPTISVVGEFAASAQNTNTIQICKDDFVQFGYQGNFPAGKSYSDYAGIYDISWAIYGDTREVIGSALNIPILRTQNNGKIEMIVKLADGNYWERGVSSVDKICPGYSSTESGDNEGRFIYDNGSSYLLVKSRVINKPTISSVSDYQVCPDGTTNLVMTNGTSPSDYYWTVNAESVVNNAASLEVDQALGSVAVSYKSTIQNSKGDFCMSESSDEVAITSFDRPAAPSITGPTQKDHCEYETFSDLLTINSDAAVEYKWSTSATTQSIDATDFGVYTATIFDSNGCESLPSSEYEIVALERPAASSLSLVGNAVNCATDENGNAISVGLSVTNPLAGLSYDWYLGESKVLDNNAKLTGVKTTGNYYVVSTNNSTNCISDASLEKAKAISVTFQPNPSAAPSITRISTYLLGASASDTQGVGVGGDYDWAFNGTALSGNSTNINKVGGSSGEYSARRAYTFSVAGTSLTCWSPFGNLTYAPDPAFTGVAVYPNPITAASSNSGKVVVNIDFLEPSKWTNGKVYIFDLAGKLAIEKSINFNSNAGILNFDVSGLGNGMYVMNIESSNGQDSFQGKIFVNK